MVLLYAEGQPRAVYDEMRTLLTTRYGPPARSDEEGLKELQQQAR